MNKPPQTVIERTFRSGLAQGFRIAAAAFTHAAMNAAPTDDLFDRAWATSGAALEAQLEKALVEYFQQQQSPRDRRAASPRSSTKVTRG